MSSDQQATDTHANPHEMHCIAMEISMFQEVS